MTPLLAGEDKDETASRERRCIVTGEVLGEEKLVRFVASPDSEIVPDIAAILPGRGIWVSADRASVAQATAKNLFARAAKAVVKAPADLAERTEALLARRMCADLGLARRAGALITGFDTVVEALRGKTPPALLVEAADGAADGKRKLAQAARAHGLNVVTIECLSSTELSLALGRENVIHAAVKSGRLAERLVFDARRLEGFRASTRATSLARNERDA